MVTEYVIKGNSAILKCQIPSFVADFVTVASWVEEISGTTYVFSEDEGKITAAFWNYILEWASCHLSGVGFSVSYFSFLFNIR